MVLQALTQAKALEQRPDAAVGLPPTGVLEELEHGVVDRGDPRQQVEVLAHEAHFGEPEVGGLALG